MGLGSAPDVRNAALCVTVHASPASTNGLAWDRVCGVLPLVSSVIYLPLSPMLKVLPSYNEPGSFLLHTHWHVLTDIHLCRGPLSERPIPMA